MDRTFQQNQRQPTKKEIRQNQKLFKQAQEQLKISKVNKGHEFAAINDLMAGYKEAKNSPTLQAVAKSLGITNFNSINDYKQVQNHLNAPRPAAAPSAPATAPKEETAPSGYSPKPLDVSGMGGGFPTMEVNMPDIPPPQMTVGGPGSSVDAGATGFRRKRSSARLAGLTSKGPSQFKITGQSAKSSGLNIGR